MNLRMTSPCVIVLLTVALPGVAGAAYIEGYTDRKSYVAGEAIGFHVSTDAPTYRIDILRDGLTTQTVATSASLPGVFQPVPPQGWLGANWARTHTWVVPGAWTSGAYYARFTASDGTWRDHPFVIRPPVPGATARILFCMEYNTRNAYNFWGGGSLYAPNPPKVRVSFLRPMFDENGRGKGSYLPPQCYGRLEAEGFSVEYLTELDVHNDPSVLSAYDVVVFSAHLEYNSLEFRQALVAHHQRGAHLAFFGANDLWWQIRYEADGQTMVGYKSIAIPSDPFYGVDNTRVTTHWHEPLLNKPGEALQGVTFLSYSGAFQAENYTVMDASHWFFENTGAQNGQTFGLNLAAGETDYIGRASPPVVDILLAARQSRPHPGATPTQPFDTVAAIFYADTPEYGFPNGRGGQVFSSGTQSFCTAMADGSPNALMARQCFRNLFDHMLANPPAPGARRR